jgi:hypothetical protein
MHQILPNADEKIHCQDCLSTGGSHRSHNAGEDASELCVAIHRATACERQAETALIRARPAISPMGKKRSMPFWLVKIQESTPARSPLTVAATLAARKEEDSLAAGAPQSRSQRS